MDTIKSNDCRLNNALLIGLMAWPFTWICAEPIAPLSVPDTVNHSEVKLGKELFNSPLLSADNTVSCATCHNLEEGGDDGLPTSIGIGNQAGSVNAPTVLNSGFNISQFWDGRSATLAKQVEEPIHNVVEMGSNWHEVINKLKKSQHIEQQFSAVYKDGITAQNISLAIAAYERQLVTVNSPFDRYLAGDRNAITPQAREGYQLFKNIGCISCHQGKNVGGNMYEYFGIMGNYFQDRGNVTEVDYGRFNVTGREVDRYKFRVPTLRNIELTEPYFHDGSAKTLHDAVRIMAKYQLGRPVSDDKIDAIVEFLKTLTGELNEDML